MPTRYQSCLHPQALWGKVNSSATWRVSFRLESVFLLQYTACLSVNCSIYGCGLINVYGMMINEENWGLYCAQLINHYYILNLTTIRFSWGHTYTSTLRILWLLLFIPPKIAFLVESLCSWPFPLPILCWCSRTSIHFNIFKAKFCCILPVWPSWDSDFFLIG